MPTEEDIINIVELLKYHSAPTALAVHCFFLNFFGLISGGHLKSHSPFKDFCSFDAIFLPRILFFAGQKLNPNSTSA